MLFLMIRDLLSGFIKDGFCMFSIFIYVVNLIKGLILRFKLNYYCFMFLLIWKDICMVFLYNKDYLRK